MQRLNLGRLLIGRPLETAQLPHQAISKRIGLAVFASDALSSTAYATEEILIILALAGGGAALFGLSIPLAIAIAILLAIVTTSYRQTIFAYPNGGGAYVGARLFRTDLLLHRHHVPYAGRRCNQVFHRHARHGAVRA